MIGLRAVASITASRRASVGRVNHRSPLALGHERERGVIGYSRRHIEIERRNIG